LRLHQLLIYLVLMKTYLQRNFTKEDLKVMNSILDFESSIIIYYLNLWLIIRLNAYLIYFYCLKIKILNQTRISNRNFDWRFLLYHSNLYHASSLKMMIYCTFITFIFHNYFRKESFLFIWFPYNYFQIMKYVIGKLDDHHSIIVNQ
jgi:hypothetical protein